MEGLESVYAQAIYGMTRESKINEHQQGSDLIWCGSGSEFMSRELSSSYHQLINPTLSSYFLSDLGVIGEIQQPQHVGNRAASMDPSSLDCCQTLWSFGGVSSETESENREIITTTTKPKSLKRNRGGDEKGGFKLIYDKNQSKPKKPRTENISFRGTTSFCDDVETDAEAVAQMKEMIYRAAAFRPVNLGLETAEKPKRKNVKISNDPQTVAARQRRERISEKIRVLQTIVPGGTKMDTASMLDEAASYLKFLRAQVKALENLSPKLHTTNLSFSSASSSLFPLFHSSFLPLQNPNYIHYPEC